MDSVGGGAGIWPVNPSRGSEGIIEALDLFILHFVCESAADVNLYGAQTKIP